MDEILKCMAVFYQTIVCTCDDFEPFKIRAIAQKIVAWLWIGTLKIQLVNECVCVHMKAFGSLNDFQNP